MATRAKPRKKQTRLVESKTEAALKRRGTEFLGVILIGIAALFVTLLWTYNPNDPSILSATDTPPTNALGLIGASLADPLYRMLAWASYGIAIVLAVWGLRLILHKGDTRVVSRAIFSPIGIALGAIFAAAHVPPDGWMHAFGLGGLFGDAVLGDALRLLPLEIGTSLKLSTLVLALLFLFVAAFSLGVNWTEAKRFFRFLKTGSILSYAALVAMLGALFKVGGKAGGAAAQKAKAARAAQKDKAARLQADAEVQAEVDADRFASRIKGSGQDEDDRVMARISEAVRKREAALSGTADGEGAAPALGGAQRDPYDEDYDYDYESDPDAPLTLGEEDKPGALPPMPLRADRSEPRVQMPERKPVKKSSRAKAEEQPELALTAGDGDAFEVPPLNLLASPTTIVRHHLSDEALEENAKMLETVLDDYGVKGEIVSVRPGPVVTMYELEPAAGLKASRVIGLADDIARSMSALATRVSTIPGRSVIGIELPNEHREKVLLREIFSAKTYGDSSHALPLALGKDIAGDPVVANLAKMPHLLIAGTTGSGKSVAINTMILSLLYTLTPDDCRLIMIDPKMLELSVYDGIPHLLSPVVTDPKKAVVALKWVVGEMEERYRKMSKMGVRNIDGYNGRVKDALAKGEAFTRTVQTGFDDETGEPVFETEEYAPETMPYIVVIVDEMADLMMVAGKEIEACIQRLAQMARASGIHLIMATQRPSVDVITGTIKANFPTRISFQVTSKIDSRTILGEMGAEQLLGMGDMLYMAGGGKITRVHGPFVSDEEVEEIVNFLKAQGAPDYVSGVVDGPESDAESEIDLVLGLGGNTNGEDALYDQAVAIVARDRKCSTSYIQRKLAIGYNKAARLVEQMEDEGVVSQANHVGKREVLVPER